MSDENEALEDQIIEGIAGPKKVEADGASTEMQPLADQIAAHQYLRGLAVTGSAWGSALRPARLVPPGAIGPRNTEGA